MSVNSKHGHAFYDLDDVSTLSVLLSEINCLLRRQQKRSKKIRQDHSLSRLTQFVSRNNLPF